MAAYGLSQATEVDFEEIYLFGAERFGGHQAEEYAAGLIERFNEIAEHPERWPAVDWIRAGYRRSVFVSHTIYYKVVNERVLIVRILSRQEPVSSLP